MGAVKTEPDLEAFVAAFDDFVRAAKRARAGVQGDETLTPSQYDLLLPLLEGDGALGLRELARAVGVAPPTATRMVDGLQARGLIVREPCPSDRRAVRLSLTGDGADAVRGYRERMRKRRRALFAALDGDERAAAARVLERLAAAYEEIEA